MTPEFRFSLDVAGIGRWRTCESDRIRSFNVQLFVNGGVDYLENAQQPWEIDAKNRFLHFLREQKGQTYVVTGENVVTNPVTRRDFDYELTSDVEGLPTIALEIFRLVGDERDLGQYRAWNDLVLRLTAELTRRGTKGYLMRTPNFNVPKSKQNQFVLETADTLADAIESHRSEEEFAGRWIHFLLARQ